MKIKENIYKVFDMQWALSKLQLLSLCSYISFFFVEYVPQFFPYSRLTILVIISIDLYGLAATVLIFIYVTSQGGDWYESSREVSLGTKENILGIKMSVARPQNSTPTGKYLTGDSNKSDLFIYLSTLLKSKKCFVFLLKTFFNVKLFLVGIQSCKAKVLIPFILSKVNILYLGLWFFFIP